MVKGLHAISNKREINYSLNTLKFFAIFAVLCLHSGFLAFGRLGYGVDLVSRFAIPVFFLISGFYSMYQDENYALEKYKTRIIRLIYLIIISNAIYIVFFILTKSNFDVWGLFTLDSCWNYIIFNVSPGTFHLWFLQALLYCYIFFWIIIKLNVNPRKLYFLIPLLIAFNLIFGEYFLMNGIEIPRMYYRNFLLTGLPFFLLGFFIRDRQEKIKELFSNKTAFCCLVVILGIIILEWSLLSIKVELSLGTALLAVLLFILCVNNPDVNIKFLTWIGGNLYALMYILQILVIKGLNLVVDLSFLGIFTVFVYFICTLILSYAVYVAKQFVSGRKRSFNGNS